MGLEQGLGIVLVGFAHADNMFGGGAVRRLGYLDLSWGRDMSSILFGACTTT